MSAPDTSSTPPSRSTPLLQEHEKLGARMVPFAGYSMPIQYSGIVKEHLAVRNNAGIFDVSHMGELRVTGAGATDFVDQCVTNDLLRVVDGQAMYTCACNEEGGILDDLIVYKHADDSILIVCNASNRDKIVPHFIARAADSPNIKVRDESDATGLLAVQGPDAFDILAGADSSLAELSKSLAPFRFATTKLGGKTVTIARTGYTGEDGFELFCERDDTLVLWQQLLAAGSSRGLLPVGLGARDTLRLEARLSLYGNELGEDVNPLEAGLAWTVKLSKENFLGNSALQKVHEMGVERTIVGFEMVGRGVARAGYPIIGQSGETIGKCTSGSPSPTLGKPIGLAFVPPSMKAIGSEFYVDCRGKNVPARVVSTPFYRRKR